MAPTAPLIAPPRSGAGVRCGGGCGRGRDSCSGRALARFAEMIAAHGGQTAVVDDPSLLPQAPHVEDVTAGFDGCVTAIDARDVARAGHVVGVGRERADQPVDPAVGIELLVEPGDAVRADQPIARLHWRDKGRDEAVQFLRSALIKDGPVRPRTGRIRSVVS